jgi:uncharacterized CHY-type Zn-finger protein
MRVHDEHKGLPSLIAFCDEHGVSTYTPPHTHPHMVRCILSRRASRVRRLTSILEHVRCPVCAMVYFPDNSMVNPCGHSICFVCAVSLVSAAADGRASCPMCRSQFSPTDISYDMKNILMSVHNQPKPYDYEGSSLCAYESLLDALPEPRKRFCIRNIDTFVRTTSKTHGLQPS